MAKSSSVCVCVCVCVCERERERERERLLWTGVWLARETVWGKVTEGPEFPAPLAFAVPGLYLLTMTHMMDGFTCLIHSHGPPGS